MYRTRAGIDECEKVQLIAVDSTPLFSVLVEFYSTTVVNFSSWNRAFSLFPRPTFLQHKGYPLNPLDEYLAVLLRKYARRGWRMQEILWKRKTLIPSRSRACDV